MIFTDRKVSLPLVMIIAILSSMLGCDQLQPDRQKKSEDQAIGGSAGHGYTIDHRVDSVSIGPFPGPRKSHGQTVYVPVYSNLTEGMTQSGREIIIPLLTNVSIRNVDPSHSLTITASRYYDTEGKELGDYLTEPRVLKPLATLTLVVKRTDLQGGVGANFLISWEADEEIVAPIIEAVVAGSQGSHGYAFRVPGKVIARMGDRERIKEEEKTAPPSDSDEVGLKGPRTG